MRATVHLPPENLRPNKNGTRRARGVRLGLTLILGVLVVLLVLLGLLAWRPSLFFHLPDALSIQQSALAPSSLILDRQGNVLYEIIDPDAGVHRPLELEQIPLALRQAVIATEDASFYTNPGVDLWGVLRAAWTNLRSGEIVSGASTITQQVARNLLMLSEERHELTWQRKLREVLLAYHLTRTLSKDEILALYLNETYLGNMAYGVEAAARAYYGKPVSQLDLAECALLAGLPQSPSAYNPLTDLPAAKERQQIVLGLMVKAGYITQNQADLAYQEELYFASEPFEIEAPHFCMWVREQLSELLGEEVVRHGGLRIETTLDLDLQHAAEDEVTRHLAELNEPADGMPGHNVRNAAVVVLDPYNGDVLAMVGSPDYYDTRSDGAVNAALALRQSGSAIKPVTYAAAFELGYSPASVFCDVRTAFTTREGDPYVPVNYDYRYHGLVSLRQALACSYNVIAVKLLDRIGVDAFVSMARRLGITSINQKERQGLALTLGSNEVSLLELTAAYGVFANGGLQVTPTAITRVTNSDGEVLYDRNQVSVASSERVLDERIAYLITDVLSDDQARVAAFGEGSALEVSFPAAVKTGTTTDWRDNWTVGYSNQVVVGVWVGNADNEPMLKVTGVTGAAPIWHAVMEHTRSLRLDGQGSATASPGVFTRPDGLVEVQVCALSGLLPSSACQNRVTELFLAENVPTQTCNLHQLITLDTRTGLLATEDTPESYRLTRRIVRWPTEALAWAEEEGLVDSTLRRIYAELAASTGETEQVATLVLPQLYLLSPDAGSVYRLSSEIPADAQQIEVAAQCDPNLKASSVTLWVDGVLWYTWSEPPYRVFWPLEEGEHVFWVEAEIRSEGVQTRTLESDAVRVTVGR